MISIKTHIGRNFWVFIQMKSMWTGFDNLNLSCHWMIPSNRQLQNNPLINKLKQKINTTEYKEKHGNSSFPKFVNFLNISKVKTHWPAIYRQTDSQTSFFTYKWKLNLSGSYSTYITHTFAALKEETSEFKICET